MTRVPNLALDHHRAGSGTPLLLLHGIGSTWRVFRSLLEPLAAAHDVLAIDLPGFGGSPPLPAGRRPTIDAMADAAEGALDAAGFARAHIVGNSMGGWIALELARRGRALGVVGLAPAGFWTDGEARWARGILATQLAVAKLLLPVVDSLVARPSLRKALLQIVSNRPERIPADTAAEALRFLVASAPTFRPLCHNMLADRPRGLEEIACPVLIAWGTKDRLLFMRQGSAAVKRIPGARFELLPGLGHLPSLDDPIATARLIGDFCAEVDAASGPRPAA